MSISLGIIIYAVSFVLIRFPTHGHLNEITGDLREQSVHLGVFFKRCYSASFSHERFVDIN